MKLNAIYFHVLYCACSICLIQNIFFYFSNSKEYICCFLEKLPIVRSASLIPIATLFFLHSMYFWAICLFVECTRSCVAYSWKYNVMKTGIFIQRISKIIQLSYICIIHLFSPVKASIDIWRALLYKIRFPKILVLDKQ